MIDAHIHFLHSTTGQYSFELLERIVAAAKNNNMDEIFLLEHTHQFIEFERVYKPIAEYSPYQCEWLKRKMGGTIEDYLEFIEIAGKRSYPVKVRFGLEVCYIPQTEDILADILSKYTFDFLTGSVHYIDNWGFDHKAEFWEGKDADKMYIRYYEIMKELIATGIFTGLAHPDSIKCFNNYPAYDLSETYSEIAQLVNKYNIYVEQSGGLALNYGHEELGMNQIMLKVFKQNGVKVLTASDAHKPEHAGANILKLQQLVEAI